MNPFTEGFVCYFFEETDMRGGKEGGEGEAGWRRVGRGRRWCCNYMNFVLPLTDTHTHTPPAMLCVSFGLDVCGMGKGQRWGEGGVGCTHILLSSELAKERERMSINEK